MVALKILRMAEKVIPLLLVVGVFGLIAYMFIGGSVDDVDFDSTFGLFKMYFILLFAGMLLMIVIGIIRRSLESGKDQETQVYTAPGPMDYERRTGNNYCKNCGSDLGKSDPRYCPEYGTRRK